MRARALKWVAATGMAVAAPLLPYLRELADEEVLYQMRDVLERVEELGWLRAPAGLAMLVVAAILAGVVNMGVVEDDDRLLAATEVTILVTGVLLGGAPFLVGALAMKRMRRAQYSACIKLLMVLAVVQVAPNLLGALPKRPDENIGMWGAVKAMFM